MLCIRCEIETSPLKVVSDYSEMQAHIVSALKDRPSLTWTELCYAVFNKGGRFPTTSIRFLLKHGYMAVDKRGYYYVTKKGERELGLYKERSNQLAEVGK